MAAEPVKGSTVAFSDKTIAKALANIYRKKFNIKTELEPELFLETVRLFNLASATGISDAVDAGTAMPDDDFLQAIKTNNEVFSAFRTHKMQNDIAKLMTDGDGKLKSFSKFAKDVKPYTDHKNRAWLQTEYNTAVIRAHQAADWKQFEREKDVLPNLEWMPSTSTHPGEDHRPFWGTILPVDHPFWNEHRPGDRWNCKCRLRNTDKEATDVPTGGSHDMPQRGLENNPGKDGKLFSKKHPYMPQSCSACPFGHGKLWALMSGENAPHCDDCRGMENAKPDTLESKLHKTYGERWDVSFVEEIRGGYIVVEQGHGQSELEQNIKSARPLANNGRKVELLRQKTILIDGRKKKIKSYDAHVDDEKWEFKYTAEYKFLDKSIGTKAAQAVEQGANILLIDIHKTNLFTVDKLIEGVYNAFHYNEPLKGICIMLESKDYIEISRGAFKNGKYNESIKKWLNSETTQPK